MTVWLNFANAGSLYLLLKCRNSWTCLGRVLPQSSRHATIQWGVFSRCFSLSHDLSRKVSHISTRQILLESKSWIVGSKQSPIQKGALFFALEQGVGGEDMNFNPRRGDGAEERTFSGTLPFFSVQS